MILIITNQYEPTTDYVIDWLQEKKASFFRINSEDITQVMGVNTFNIDSDTVTIGGHTLQIADINVVWYRRWYEYRTQYLPVTNRHERQAFSEMREEANCLSYFFFRTLSHKKWLSDPFVNVQHNKLHALRVARRLGLKTPNTIVTNDKNELADFFLTNDKHIITKPMSDPFVFIDEKTGDNYKSFTEKITEGFIATLEDKFYISLFQSYVTSKYELRIFFIDGSFYATAIIHSKTTDIKLSVSFGVSKINMIAYQLPDKIEDKLRKLMRELNLNSGSIDMIEDENGELYFLEVNPIGQFMGYAVHNNYYLDEKIADWLIKNDYPS